MSVKIKEYPGTPVKIADLRSGAIPSVRFDLKAKYAFTAGIAYSRYLSELKEGRIIARKCRKCARVLVPPRMFCEVCFKPTDEWVYVSDEGEILTYSVSYVGPLAERLKEPTIVAVIKLDGASPGMGILHRLGEVRPEDVRIGMRVKAVWRPEAEREGSVNDIAFFKPIG